MPVIVPFQTLTELFQNLVKNYKGSGKTAFARKLQGNKPYSTLTWDEVSTDVEALAAYLVEQGVQPGDRVALLSENRYEWVVVDLALQVIGAVNVSLYATLPATQCAYILQDSGAKLFFVSTGIQLKKALNLFDECPELTQIIAFDQPKIESYSTPGYVALFDDVLKSGYSFQATHQNEMQTRTAAVNPEDVATLIYTSGTTGPPKGAMLTHHNIVSNVKAVHRHLHVDESDRCLSFLPLCHCFERTAGYYAMIACGAEIYYAESIDTVAKNMIEAKPTLVLSVPRLFEKIHAIVTQKVEKGSTAAKKIFEWAFIIGQKYVDGRRGMVTVQKKIADKLVFSKLKERTGGRIRFFVSGGAPLPPEIARFFKTAGLNIVEGYGLTETSPIMTANKFGDEKIGTVGSVLEGITVGIQRLSDGEIICEVSGESYPTELDSQEGEIVCKGPNVMKGYWQDEGGTKEIIDEDGWLHTGDIGRFVEGNLKITDRLKHMIVNAGGKNIYPAPIEALFVTNKWIAQIMVVGENQPFMAALMVPDFDELELFAQENGIKFSDRLDLINQDDVKALYKQQLQQYASDLASYEKIRDFRLLAHEFTIETGELTPTLKVKRRVVEEKYANLINSMFSKRQ